MIGNTAFPGRLKPHTGRLFLFATFLQAATTIRLRHRRSKGVPGRPARLQRLWDVLAFVVVVIVVAVNGRRDRSRWDDYQDRSAGLRRSDLPGADRTT